MYKSLVILFVFCFMNLTAQNNFLTKKITVEEINQMDDYLSSLSISSDVITTPPNFNIRTMAEWEEIQSLTIAWEGFEPILTEIVRNSVNECKVFIALYKF